SALAEILPRRKNLGNSRTYPLLKRKSGMDQSPRIVHRRTRRNSAAQKFVLKADQTVAPELSHDHALSLADDALVEPPLVAGRTRRPLCNEDRHLPQIRRNGRARSGQSAPARQGAGTRGRRRTFVRVERN